MAKGLTVQFLKNVKEPKRYYDCGNSGLIFHVRNTGAKSWAQRIRIDGKQIELGLGSFDTLSLIEARSLASRNKMLVTKGINPKYARDDKKRSRSFSEVTEEYLPIKLAELSNEKHIEQWKRTLEQIAFPRLGNLAVEKIKSADIQSALSPVWKDRNETARRVRGRIESVLNYAIARGYRPAPNPAAWQGNLSILLPKIPIDKERHQPALNLADAKRWWEELNNRDGAGARALALVALTASRSVEVRGMRWEEITLFSSTEAEDKGFAGIWTRPAGRMKEKRAHRVPITHLMMSYIGAPDKEQSEYVFNSPTGGMLSDMTLNALMKRMHNSDISGYLDIKLRRPAVPHGLRSTFRDWVAENELSREAAELQLDHKFGSSVEHAYYRTDLLDKRGTLMTQWGNFLNDR